MRHGKKVNHLGRKSAHRKALMKNLTLALIQHKRINTTLAKAKALRQYVEPLVTKSKSNTTHSRRVVFSYLQNKDAIKELFGEIATKVAERPGGYVRIIKTGFRKGDGAETAMIEFVDFNDVYVKKESGNRTTSKKKRSRRGGGKKSATAAAATTEAVQEIVKDTTGEEE
jgi:large subunit ribosomal protein L17